MPTYGAVPITADLTAFKTPIANAKIAGTYDAAAANWDQQVLASIQTNCNLANGYVKTSNEYTQKLYGESKLAIDQIEKILAKKDLKATDVEIIAALKGKIEKASTDADADSRALTGVLAPEYRAGWPAVARPLLNNPAPVDAFVDIRKKEIDEGKMFAAYRIRLREWVTRAAEFLKQGTQRSKQGGVDIVEFQADMKDFLAKMTKANLDIGTTGNKAKTSMDDIEKIGKQKVISVQDKKNAKDKIVTLTATMKTLRGAMKTMDIEFDGLKARAKMAGPGWKEPALKAVKSGKDLHDASTKLVTASDKREKEINKTNEKIQKA